MNRYFKPMPEEAYLPGLYGPHKDLDRVIEVALAGQLRERDILPICNGGEYASRSIFCQQVGWAIHTVEFQKSLAAVIGHGKRVLEVGAGRGLLGLTMPSRMGAGSEWICTDREPPPPTPHNLVPRVIRADAIWSIQRYRPDCVYVSWVPYRSDLDFRLAQECAKRRIPLIVTGEGWGGCCGSMKFWNHRHARYRIIDDAIQHDVPQWYGMNAHTIVVRPK